MMAMRFRFICREVDEPAENLTDGEVHCPCCNITWQFGSRVSTALSDLFDFTSQGCSNNLVTMDLSTSGQAGKSNLAEEMEIYVCKGRGQCTHRTMVTFIYLCTWDGPRDWSGSMTITPTSIASCLSFPRAARGGINTEIKANSFRKEKRSCATSVLVSLHFSNERA